MIRVIFIIIVNALITVICAIIGLLDIPLLRKGKLEGKFEKIWAGLILKVSGVSVSVQGLENINKNKQYVFVANHLSMFDIPAVISAIPNEMKMLAKKELFRIPLFGWVMYAGRHIRIDRQNRERAIHSLDSAVERLKKEDISILVYAEGTRSPDGEIKNFKKGAFVLAIRSGVPIVPVTISGSREIVPKKSLKINKGTIRIFIDKPLETKNFTLDDKDFLLKKVRELIVSRYESINI
ncbi:1-acyl-sn-glycerol-3-phosphate acyltransferase [candidate division KSB1 bacterium]|nr:MAG: 1-acyl-sn-glycerol-3-phosphate acyltransferase [candidate division KSB1 bacterium]